MKKILFITIFILTAIYGNLYAQRVDYSTVNYSTLERDIWYELLDFSRIDRDKHPGRFEGMHYGGAMWYSPGRRCDFWLRLYSDTTYVFHTVSKFGNTNITIRDMSGNVHYRSNNKRRHRVVFTPRQDSEYYYTVSNQSGITVASMSIFNYIVNSGRGNVRDYTEIILQHMDQRGY